MNIFEASSVLWANAKVSGADQQRNVPKHGRDDGIFRNR